MSPCRAVSATGVSIDINIMATILDKPFQQSMIFTFSYVVVLLFLGQFSKMEILMDLHATRSPESENHTLLEKMFLKKHVHTYFFQVILT